MSALASEPSADRAGYRRGVALVLLAGLCWSTMGLIIRLMEVAGTWQILLTRSITLVLLLLVVLALRHRGRPDLAIRRAGLPGVLGGLGLVVAFSGGVHAIIHTSVANAVFLFASAPFMVALLSRLVLGESVRRGTWIAMAAALVGVALMVGQGVAAGRLAGNVTALLSAAGFALFTLALRRGRSGDMLPAVCLGGLFTAVTSAVVCLATGQAIILPPHDFALAVGLGLFQLGLGGLGRDPEGALVGAEPQGEGRAALPLDGLRSDEGHRRGQPVDDAGEGDGVLAHGRSLKRLEGAGP